MSMLDAMQLLQSARQESTETTAQNCFRKAGKSEETPEIQGENDDSFKDFIAENDMELDEKNKDLRIRFQEGAPLQ